MIATEDMMRRFSPEFLKNEKPLEYIPADGGMVGVLRTIGCVGDSLSSGEFESTNLEGGKGYHDYFDYSWGQYMARMAGVTVRNFSRGGMTAREYCETFASQNDFWNPELACSAYIIALGLNDLFGRKMDVGTMAWMPPMPGLRMLRAKKQATPATMEATAPEALASFQ